MRFSRPDGGLAFFGPDWYLLRPGNGVCAWPAQSCRSSVRLVLADSDLVLAELQCDAYHLEGEFFLDSGAAHFEVRAFAQA
ncbi:hypothetical protein LP419_26540 [Massilia sp. H-1]|nr:hypothetical protein LP419_26540 [Massilia sp. H-1]